MRQPKKYFQKMTEVVKKGDNFFDDDFKDLFISMMAADPDERPSLAEIKRSKYFNGPVYDNQTLKELMKAQLANKKAETITSLNSQATKRKA
mmetsp:Transcript_56130/g.77817  ORF Transcript_56130/g.77817 Transcript_56130/m.77817 type:complete len:92 (+) Transcript_56130:873-1148(+)